MLEGLCLLAGLLFEGQILTASLFSASQQQRVYPEQITINIAKDAKVPEAPAGHNWKEIVHDNTVTWLAYWKENINDNFKYVFLAAGSSFKGQSDYKKFEKARELKVGFLLSF